RRRLVVFHLSVSCRFLHCFLARSCSPLYPSTGPVGSWLRGGSKKEFCAAPTCVAARGMQRKGTSSPSPSLPKNPVQLLRRRGIAQPFGEDSDAETAGVFDLVVADSNRHEKAMEPPEDVDVGRLGLTAGEAVALRKAD